MNHGQKENKAGSPVMRGRFWLRLLLVVSAAVAVFFAARWAGRLPLTGQNALVGQRPDARPGAAMPAIGFELDEAEFSDASGVWLELRDIRLELAPVRIGSPTVTVRRASVGRAVIRRRPSFSLDSGAASFPSPDAPLNADFAALLANGRRSGSGSTDRLPGKLLLDSFEVHELVLLPEASGLSGKLSAGVSGSGSWHPGHGAQAGLAVLIGAPYSLRAEVSARFEEPEARTTFDIVVDGEDSPDSLRAGGVLEPGKRLRMALDLTSGRVRAEFAGELDLASDVPLLDGGISARLAADAAGPEGWLDGFLPLETAGDLQLQAVVADGVQSLNGTARVAFSNIAGLRLEKMEVAFEGRDLYGAVTAAGFESRIGNARYGNWHIREAELQTSGFFGDLSREQESGGHCGKTAGRMDAVQKAIRRWRTGFSRLEFDGMLQADFRDRPMRARVAGGAQGVPLAAGGQQLKLARLDGAAAGVDFSLTRPMVLRREPDLMALEPFVFDIGKARFAGFGRLATNAVTGRLQWNAPSLAWIPGVAASGFDAAAQGGMVISGAASQPDVRLDLSVSDFLLDGQPPPPPWIGERLLAGAETRTNGIAFSATLQGAHDDLAELRTFWPGTFHLTPFPALRRAPEAEPRGSLAVDLPLAMMADLWLPDDTRRVGGKAQGTLDWRGEPGDMHFSGEAAIRDGKYQDLLFGTDLRDINILVRGDRYGLVIEKGEARDRGKGRATLAGRVEIWPWGIWTHDLRLQLSQLMIVARDDATAFVDGELALAGDAAASQLGGTLRLSPVEIRLPEQLPGTVPVLPVVDPDAPETPETERPAFLFPDLEMDVIIEFPRRVFVRNRAVDTEWQGRLAIGGTPAQPEIGGSLNVVHGRFMVLGRRFALREGRIWFPVGPAMPHFDAVAETAAGEITARLRLSGTPHQARWELSSVPELPEDEILAHIFFRRPQARPTPGEALRLARAVEELTGGGHLTDVLEFGRRTLRVDRIDLVESEGPEGTPRVSVGKYIGEYGFIDLEKDMVQAEGARARVSYYVAPGISLETEIEADGERGIGLLWQWDY